MMRRAGSIIAALVAVMALSSSPSTAQDVPRIGDVPAGVLRLLEDYGRAYETHDEKLLAATLTPELLPDERTALRNARKVPFDTFRVRATTQYSGDLTSPRIRSAYAGRDVVVHHVIEETALDVEAEPYVDDGAFTFVRDRRSDDRYEGWRMASKNDLDVLGFFSPDHLWDTGPVSVLRSDRFTLLTHPDAVEEMRPVLDVAEEALDRAREFWSLDAPERYVIIVPTTTAELGRLIHATIDLQKFVAFVAAGADREKGWDPAGPRMFVHLQHLRNYSKGGQFEILAHELIHAVTRPVSGPHIPTWVEEGVANLGGGSGARPSLAAEGPAPDEFPTNDKFVTGPVRGIQIVYDQAQEAIEVLVDEFDNEGLARFYTKLGSYRVSAGTEEYHVRRAVSESLEWSIDEWTAEWRERLD